MKLKETSNLKTQISNLKSQTSNLKSYPLQLYDQLLQFPLFQGMSRDDLEQVAGFTKFSFVKLSAGKCVAAEDTPCRQLLLLLSGSLTVETRSDDHGYSVIEQLSAPYSLQPEALFGYHQRYTHTFTAQTPVSLIALDKSEVVRLTEEFLVFRLNVLNIFTTLAQKGRRQPWRSVPMSLRQRIVRFFTQHVLLPAGPKEFRILMTRLAGELNDSRLDVSRALNEMQADGLIVLHRGRIEIPQMERLAM